MVTEPRGRDRPLGGTAGRRNLVVFARYLTAYLSRDEQRRNSIAAMASVVGSPGLSEVKTDELLSEIEGELFGGDEG